MTSFCLSNSSTAVGQADSGSNPKIEQVSKKAALLIGIADDLLGSHKDVNMMYELLTDTYGYPAANINVLLDDKQDGHIQPTTANILQAIDNLVRGARSGDTLFFVFAGHAYQDDSAEDNSDEEDGKDEYIVTSNGEYIQDDILNERLVKPLPVGCKLTAVMDACNSGTLLDLKHYHCNQVWVPWISKGPRHSNSRWVTVARRNDKMLTGSQIFTTSLDESTGNTTEIKDKRTNDSGKGKIPLAVITNHANTFLGQTECSSPIGKFCDGFNCRRFSLHPPEHPIADVICLSSSEDFQKTWQIKGVSVTQLLIEFLRQSPSPIIKDVVTHICHELHRNYMQMQDDNKHIREMSANHRKLAAKPSSPKQNGLVTVPAKRKSDPQSEESSGCQKLKQRKTGQHQKPQKSLSVEMVNFQQPVLSSQVPLDMESRWSM